jgi:hypothetical protein
MTALFTLFSGKVLMQVFKMIFVSILAMMALEAQAAPFVVSDPTTQSVTHCVLLLNSKPAVDSPLEVTTGGKRCKVDVSTAAIGVNSLRLRFASIDPIWGRVESADSTPFTFTRPGSENLSVPDGLGLTP